MQKKIVNPFVTLAVMLVLITGCASVPVEPEANKAAVVSRELAKTTRSWDGENLPAYAPGQPEVTIRRITVPAGARLETHRHPVINAGVMLSGQLTVVTVEGKTLHLKAGDPIVEVVNTLHYGINEGTVPAELVVFYAGTVNTPITIVEPH